MPNKYIGETINGLLVLNYKNKGREFTLRCDKCGEILTRKYATVVLRKAKCKCCYTRQKRNTDGFSGTKLKSVYMNILDRCYNAKNHAYKDYGGRGISVCDEWLHDFKAFYDWAMSNGYKEGLTIERINVNGEYAPENCRWATKKEQASNRRSNHLVNYNGKDYTVSQLADMLQVNRSTIYYRLKRGLL